MGYCCPWPYPGADEHHTRTHAHTHSLSLSKGLPWTRNWPVAETSTSQHTTYIKGRHPCPWRGSNPKSQQASGRRPLLERVATGIGPCILVAGNQRLMRTDVLDLERNFLSRKQMQHGSLKCQLITSRLPYPGDHNLLLNPRKPQMLFKIAMSKRPATFSKLNRAWRPFTKNRSIRTAVTRCCDRLNPVRLVGYY